MKIVAAVWVFSKGNQRERVLRESPEGLRSTGARRGHVLFPWIEDEARRRLTRLSGT